ncbi:hypothetical protein I7I48_02849 [Histoplasma ohiense]|nr:hypothetical protein I7I48_02849 [Histoplasma ohiense (nom. inval.)]
MPPKTLHLTGNIRDVRVQLGACQGRSPRCEICDTQKDCLAGVTKCFEPNESLRSTNNHLLAILLNS